MNLDDGDLRSALLGIAGTPNGLTLYLFLQKTICSVPPEATSDALREHHGRRTFAAELMAGMAEGIRESHGGSDPTERPIVFERPKPVELAGRESGRDYIARTLAERGTGRTGGSNST